VSDLDVLTFPEALNFVKGVYATDRIYENQKKSIIVEIDSGILESRPEDLHEFSTATCSLNLVIIGLITGTISKTFSDLLHGFDTLFGFSDDGLSVQVTGLEEAAQDLSLCVAKNPQAAITLAQILRQQAFDDVAKGLILESLGYAMLQNGSEFTNWLKEREPVVAPPDENQVVLSDRIGNQLNITLNRPQRANAFSSKVRDGFVEALQVALIDESIDEITVKGNGKSFCSGGELSEFGLFEFPTDGHLTRLSRNPGMLVHRLKRKIVPYLHGACAGAGIEIPAFASKIVAHETTRIFLPEVSMGLIPGAGGTVSIPRRIGRHRAFYLAVTGHEINANDAYAWGLVDELTSD
tara:strand:+ start:521 stop:1576 length:1056 start_codon:yes stop_codon:yes gene_type:complete